MRRRQVRPLLHRRCLRLRRWPRVQLRTDQTSGGGYLIPDLRQQLDALAGAAVAWFGLGNSHGGDDGVGLRLAELLLINSMRNVAVLGLQPELSVSHANVARAAHVVFLDATDFGAQPGAVTFLDAARIESRFPQLSTHRIALSTIARLLLNQGIVGVWLMGIQPGSLCPRHELTPAVQITVELLANLIVRCFAHQPGEMTIARIQPPHGACGSMRTVEASPS